MEYIGICSTGLLCITMARIPERFPGGGVASIHAGMGYAIFSGRLFRAENKFWGVILEK